MDGSQKNHLRNHLKLKMVILQRLQMKMMLLHRHQECIKNSYEKIMSKKEEDWRVVMKLCYYEIVLLAIMFVLYEPMTVMYETGVGLCSVLLCAVLFCSGSQSGTLSILKPEHSEPSKHET
jgi:hypothetical protein